MGGERVTLTTEDQKLLERALMASTEKLYEFGNAPAEMPGEAIRRIIEDALCEPDPVRFAAANIAALFAPILAEKEATIERLMEVEQADLLPLTHPVFSLPPHVRPFKWAKLVGKLRDRALAAEAALAEVRAENAAYRQNRHFVMGFNAGFEEACEQGLNAAAIRAQGE